MIDEKRLQEIRARADAASPGPWKPMVEGREHQCGSSFIMIGEGPDRRDDIELIGAPAADYDFIARARQDVPLLVDEVLRLQKAQPIEVSAFILDSTSNQGVVKLPGRRFPGLVIQGDTLSILRGDIAEAADLLKAGNGASAASALGDVTERLDDLLAHYEKVLRAAGYELPYG